VFKEWNQQAIPVLESIRGSSLQASIDRALVRFSQDIGAPRIRLMPHPLVFDRDEYDRLAAACVHILEAQARLAAALLTRHSRADVLHMLGLPEAWERYVDWEQLVAGRHRVARVDLIPLRDGHAICELNFAVAVGGGDLHDYYRIHADAIGFPASDADVSPFQNLADLYQASCEQVATDELVLLDWSSHAALGYPNQHTARVHLSRRMPGMDIQVHDENSLAAAWCGRRTLSRALIHRCFTFDDVTTNVEMYDDLLQRGARFSNGLEAELLMSKGWLALLWDTANHALFTPHQVDAIATFLLPTWTLHEDDRDGVLADKDRLIFKQKNTYGGEGIVLGSQLTSAALWQHLREAGLDTWIAQRFVETPLLRHAIEPGGPHADHRVVLGLYLHGEKASGIVVRSGSRSAVVNAGSGARAGWAPALTAAQREQLYQSILSMH